MFENLEGELAFAPIGPEAKAAALYLRHEIKLPYRKVRMGTRSEEGSRNIGIFTSLTQTATLQKSSVLDLFRELPTGTPAQALGLLFPNSS